MDVNNPAPVGLTPVNVPSPPPLPWWRQKWPVSIVVATIAAVAPVTTAVHTWIESAAQKALSAEKQRNEMRQQYLLLALEKREDDSKRLPVLRFLAALDEPVLAKWAAAELNVVQEEIDRLKDDLKLSNTLVAMTNKAKFKASSDACEAVCGPALSKCTAECRSTGRSNCQSSCFKTIQPCLEDCHAQYK